MSVEPVYLQPNRFIDSDHPTVIDWAHTHAGASTDGAGQGRDPRELAVALYYAVRDGFRYNPWNVYLAPEDYSASAVLRRDREQGAEHGAHCVDKAILLAACARVYAIPSRLHFANVRNHVGTARLEQQLGSDLLVYHGYCELWLDGRWVAATPAFNRQLCERLGVAPLEFDGREDSVFQEYDATAGRFMEYIADHGAHAEVPFEAMIGAWREHYPRIISHGWPKPDAGLP